MSGMCDVSLWVCRERCAALPVSGTVSDGGLADGGIGRLDKTVEFVRVEPVKAG